MKLKARFFTLVFSVLLLASSCGEHFFSGLEGEPGAQGNPGQHGSPGQSAQEWLVTPEGQTWFHSTVIDAWQKWIDGAEGKAWLNSPEGQAWLSGAAGLNWQTWKDGPEGQEWLSGAEGQAWLNSPEGQAWLAGAVDDSWLLKPDTQAWLDSSEGQAWIDNQVLDAWQAWLDSPEGHVRLEAEGSKLEPNLLSWLLWLETSKGKEWLKSQDGLSWIRMQVLNYSFQEFFAGGLFTVPADVEKIYVTACAGGAGGLLITYINDLGTYVGYDGNHNGGGAGEYVVNEPIDVSPGQSLFIVVGAAGQRSVFNFSEAVSGHHRDPTNGGDTIIYSLTDQDNPFFYLKGQKQ